MYYRIADSGFTVPDLNKRPAINTDVVDKQYVDNTFLTQSLFEINNALPGLPVTNGLAMAFIPTLRTCTVTSSGQINDITDPLTGVTLNAPTGFMPELKIDSDGVYYLSFSNHRLYKDQISVSDLGGPNGNTTTFFLIMKAKATKNQTNFNWIKEVATNTYNNSVRFGAHIPWSNNNVYIDHASTANGRLSGTYWGTLNQKQVWGYRRNGAWAEVRLNNTHQHSVNNLTSRFVSGDVGRFMIGNGNGLVEPAAMDFYGLFFYNRNLSNDEIKQMDFYITNYFKL